jgi:tRNA-dihydrouridine synthase B
MISANALVNRHQLTTRLLHRDTAERPVCFQLFGNEAGNLAEATKIATDAGADFIDLNCGCSVPKIRRSGSGAELLMDRKKLHQILVAMRKNTTLPLIAKIRVALDEETNLEIVKAVVDAGIDALVVHGRNWRESYGTPCRYDAIGFFVANVKIPVIGNGDVADLESLKKMLATGCAGVMVARALVGRPWLLEKLAAQLEGREFNIPSLVEIGEIFIKHVEHLIRLTGSERIAVLQARKLAKGYSISLKNRRDFCSTINTLETFEEFHKLCEEHFRS